MKRRTFMASSAGLLGGQLISSATVNAQSGKPVSVARTSLLFERAPARPKEFIQDLLVWNDVLYCLHADVPTGYWGITATNTEGERLSHRDLPRGIYLKLGIQSEALLVHALTYYDLADHANPNCVLRLERNGSIRVLASMGTDFKGTLHFAGDSFFLGVRDAGAVEVWRGDDSVMSRIGTSKIPGPLGSAHFDLLSPNLMALTQRDASSMTTVEIPSALTAEYQINVPEVNAAIEMYRREDASRGNPVVIPATGSDHNGLLYALLPASKQTIQAMRLDSKANGSVWLSFQRPPRNAGAPRVPCNLTVRPSEVGMTYPDGDVAWYAV